MKPDSASESELSLLPSVDDLLRSDTGRRLAAKTGSARLTMLSRIVVGELRDFLRQRVNGDKSTKASLLLDAETRLAEKWTQTSSTGSRQLINATGVVIHTNLGRAPLSDPAKAALLEAAGYCNVEYDLRTGRRGSRGERVESMLCELTGAEDALVVNNCAAAAFLVLTVFAAGREVVISRGELVEIGGDFRVPDVLARSRGLLKEVGTTNRTKLSDYEKAIGENTAMILKVHPSNYRIVGFTAAPTVAELADLAHRKDLLFYEDAGSGAVFDLGRLGLADEPVIGDSIAAGADIVTFSGDKLLGGPQAGMIVGSAALIDRIRTDALYRALRVDKLILAALEATLNAYLRGTAGDEIPVLRMLEISRADIEKRADRIRKKIDNSNLELELIEGNSAVGGGSGPLVKPKTVLIALRHRELSTAEVEAKLRSSDPPVIARIVEERVVIDLRTVSQTEEAEILSILNRLN